MCMTAMGSDSSAYPPDILHFRADFHWLRGGAVAAAEAAVLETWRVSGRHGLDDGLKRR